MIATQKDETNRKESNCFELIFFKKENQNTKKEQNYNNYSFFKRCQSKYKK